MNANSPVRLTGKALGALRQACMERDGWRCCECRIRVTDDVPEWHFRKAEMAHIKSRGAGGSDTLNNVRCLCALCHRNSHNAGGKPVPKKV